MATELLSKTPCTKTGGLSFKVMQSEALRLIRAGCFEKGIRSPQELGLLAGISAEKASLVYPCPKGPGRDDTEALNLNGKEWDGLLAAADVSLETWVEKSTSRTPNEVSDKDLVTEIAPEYLASSNGQRPVPETEERIGRIVGYSSAFFLKASGVVLPSSTNRS